MRVVRTHDFAAGPVETRKWRRKVHKARCNRCGKMRQAQALVRLTLFRPHACAFRSDWLIVYAELRFSQRFPQCFPQFLCKESVTFSNETWFVARKVHDRRCFSFSLAGVDNTVDRISKVDCELIGFTDRRFTASVRARREQRSALREKGAKPVESRHPSPDCSASAAEDRRQRRRPDLSHDRRHARSK
jgi:hypothetical protein